MNGNEVAVGLLAGVVSIVSIAVGLTLVAGVGIIPAGDVGIVTQWGRPTGELKDTGIYVVFEPLGYSVYPMQSSAIRSLDVTGAEAASLDLQTVTTDITMNFHLNQTPAQLIRVYTVLRDNFQGVIRPLTLEAVKSVTAKYTAQDLIDRRARVKSQLDDLLISRLSKYGIQVDNVSLTQFTFSDQFNTAIENKVTQEQQALQAKAKLSQVQYEAQQTVTRARAEATALGLQRMNVTAELVDLRRIEVAKAAVEKWDGHMPTVTSGGINSLPTSIFGGTK